MSYSRLLSDCVTEDSATRLARILPELAERMHGDGTSPSPENQQELQAFLGPAASADGASVLAQPLAPAALAAPGFAVDNALVLGTIGLVRVPRASIGHSFQPPSAEGEIITVERNDKGAVAFDGALRDPDGPGPRSHWVQAWNVVIPFPCTTVLSDLTYTLRIKAAIGVVFTAARGHVSSFVSQGATAEFAGNPEVDITNLAGIPVQQDLSQMHPDGSYNGLFGKLHGETLVTGTLRVAAGQVAALGVSYALVVHLLDGPVDLRFQAYSRFVPESPDGLAGVCHYQSVPVAVLAPE